LIPHLARRNRMGVRLIKNHMTILDNSKLNGQTQRPSVEGLAPTRRFINMAKCIICSLIDIKEKISIVSGT
jgi:hypothetical protein